MIRLENVTKAYGELIALDGVSLVVPTGGTTVLIGPSGSGKSTALALMVGLATPDDGRVLIDGEPLTPRSALALRRRMGYVIQDGGLFPHLTARENIALMATESGWESKRIDARIDALRALTRFPDGALARYPIELSGGQRQRVSLMRALMLDPDMLLMDEPLGALDPMIRADLQDDLKAIFLNLGKTVVLVTHDLGEAAFFGGTVVLMHQGRIAQQGPIAELIGRPADAFVARFVDAHRRRLIDMEGRDMEGRDMEGRDMEGGPNEHAVERP